MSERPDGSRTTPGGATDDSAIRALLPLIAAELPRVLPAQRWYGGKEQAVTRVVIRDTATIAEHPSTLLAVLDVFTADGASAAYFVPLGLTEPGQSASAGQVIVRHGDRTVRDAIADADTCRALLGGILHGVTLQTEQGGTFAFRQVEQPGSAAAAPAAVDPATTSVRYVGAEQSNTSVIFGNALILKALRRLAAGTNPEIEIPHFLGEHTAFSRVPPLVGWGDYCAPDGTTAPVGVLQRFVPNDGDGWSYVLRLAATLGDAGPHGTDSSGAQAEDARRLVTMLAALGRTLAELHVALASRPDIAAFAPEPITDADLSAWRTRTHASLDDVLARLHRGLPTTSADPTQAAADQQDSATVQAGAERLRAIIDGIGVLADGRVVKTRHHGDFHLGQTLVAPDGWIIIDFEGEPLRSLDERRAKQTPLRDVAGLLRSLEYARATAERRPGADSAALTTAFTDCRAAVLAAYTEAIQTAGTPLLPARPADQRRALLALELEKALYELVYELGNRPDWVPIPLSALARLAQADAGAVQNLAGPG
jgi:maltose alpha-D-glucosyltransferase/alpha-amylase